MFWNCGFKTKGKSGYRILARYWNNDLIITKFNIYFWLVTFYYKIQTSELFGNSVKKMINKVISKKFEKIKITFK